MFKKMFFMFVLLVVSLAVHLFPDVPPGRTHQPNVPYFLESMNFQTVQMHIFPAGYSGMVIDSYSDLMWNPAYILRQSEKSVYLDYNTHNHPSSQSVPVFSQYDRYDSYYPDNFIQPGWYSHTRINTVQTSPLYHLAAIIPLGSKVTIGFINRSINGHHVEAGMGLIFSPGENTRTGFFIGLTRGKSSEEIISKDNRDTWSERDTNPVYYDTNQRFLESGESYSCKGKKPNITITFEQDISRNLILRSFFSYTWWNLNTSGHYFGLVYQFSFGGKLFFRSQGDIFQTSNWALGFEMSW